MQGSLRTSGGLQDDMGDLVYFYSSFWTSTTIAFNDIPPYLFFLDKQPEYI